MTVSTEGRTITETDITMFSYLTGDWTHLHSNAVEAKKSFFGERVAHGYLTLSVSLGLMVRSGLIDAPKFIALKSIDTVKFLKPVKIGDTVFVKYESKRTADEKHRFTIVTEAETLNQNEEVVLRFQTTHLESEL